jgi:hypothetical protein
MRFGEEGIIVVIFELDFPEKIFFRVAFFF